VSLRKEQVLLLVVVALAAWRWTAVTGEGGVNYQFRSTPRAYDATAPAPAQLAPGQVPSLGKRALRPGIFVEPSETQPLPPMDLAFPPRPPLSLAALPLEPGLDLGHLDLRMLPGTPAKDVTLVLEAAAAGAGGAGEDPAAETTPTQESREEKKARAARIYDRIFLDTQPEPFFGVLEFDGNRFDLESDPTVAGKELRMRVFSLTEWKIGPVSTFPVKEVRKVQLADTLRNEVERRKRTVPRDAGHLRERGELIEWLLQQAREAPECFNEALAQAELVYELSNGDLEGLRWKVRVLRASGELAKEFDLFRTLSGRHEGSAFQYEGLGALKARLGLDADAEADLLKAVELAPQDPAPLATYAWYLLSRQRTAQAVVMARRAFAAIGSITAAVDRTRVVGVITACELAAGNFEQARDAVASAGMPLPLLAAAVAYAEGDAEAALAAYQQAAAGSEAAAARLGAGAALAALGRWQEAADAFLAVADQSPLLRARALTGIALLQLRVGQPEAAITWVDRALEADPTDAYAHYLRGRASRELGQLQSATESLQSALRVRDDFVAAVAEMAACKAAEAIESRSATEFVAAMRYAERAVSLANTKSAELLERLGMMRFAAGDVRGAAEAFGEARESAPDAQKPFSRAAIALCDYARGGTDEARTQLQRLAQDLPRDHELRAYTEQTLARIDDHSQKERLDDGFERTELGSIWTVERDGALGPTIGDGKVVLRGSHSKAGEVWAERPGVLAKGGRFLALRVRMAPGAAQATADAFVGMRLETQRAQAGSQSDFRASLGMRDGRPYLLVEDGRAEAFRKEFTLPGFSATAAAELELRVLPRDEAGRLFALQAFWNGQPLLEQPRPLDNLRRDTQFELRTQLFAAGARGGAVDVTFDEYHLERRKDG
jgi:tetratricopeptide (TPR) repeat protein